MFKNSIAYSIVTDKEITSPAIETNAIRKIGALESKIVGWCPVVGDEYVKEVTDGLFLCLMTKEKILPASVIDDALADEVAEIESGGTLLSKKRIKQIREDIIDKLLPAAFVKKTKTLCFIGQDYLIIDTSSPGKADDVVHLLFKTFESFAKITQLDSSRLSELLTKWSGDPELVPDPLLRSGSYAIKSIDNEKKVRLKGFYDGEELGAEDFVHAGEIVTDMSLCWEGKVSFTLTDNFVLKQLSYDLSSCDKDSTNAYQIMLSELEITAHELTGLFDTLVDLTL